MTPSKRYRQGRASPPSIVQLDGCAGPIDPLLALVRQQRVDLGHISIPALADQFTAAQQFRSLGIDPCEAKIVIAKGVHSPRPAMEPIAREMIWVNTPGVTAADLTTFAYRHRRVPLYPLEPNAAW